MALAEGRRARLDVEPRPRVLLGQLPLLVGLGGGLVHVDVEREQLQAGDDGAIGEEAALVGLKRLQEGGALGLGLGLGELARFCGCPPSRARAPCCPAQCFRWPP